MNPAGWTIRVPASSANLGAGFDALGMAVTMHVHAGLAPVGLDAVPPGARTIDQHHPAAAAFEAVGGEGDIWLRSPIPMGRGLGYSGAVRVAGALLGVLQRERRAGGTSAGGPALNADVREEVVRVTGDLEGHRDNVAASVFGGVVTVAGDRAVPIDVALRPAVVVWVPDGTATSTTRSRGGLPDTVPFADAVANIGRTAVMVAALVSGDIASLRVGVQDRLHQQRRLAKVPTSAAALALGEAAGAWCGWLSGSGPTIAFLCDPADAERVGDALPSGGHVKVVAIDREGAVVVGASAGEGDVAVGPGADTDR